MNEYDVLFAVILRFKDTDMDSLDLKLEGYSERLGDCISEVFTDCFVAPIAMDDASEDIMKMLSNFKIIGE